MLSLTSSREILDQQDGNIEDDGLTGLLRLATSVLKHKPPFKFSREGQEFLRDVHNLLFLLPSLADRAQPKCKSHSARAAAYDLLVEMVKGSVENYRLLHNWVIFVCVQYSEEIKHKTTLLELQKMFTYLMKNTVKTLFGGVITNNVVSLVSRPKESLDEVTIKDTLEGDNMYTCSQCGKKVRAEKRACFKKLPRILSFNTMRYTFNMVTMMKEKVNTHFSFPLRLDMTPYTEDFLMGKGERKEGFRDEGESNVNESYEYDLIGVTVHTGTADGGHYYSFIRDIVNPHAYKNNKW
ncbi:Ubiquitin carboxyl-terminal hydrolase 34 [Xenoophorus captivus]|uniref:Ubiquitin carboxyl-terminal hydrolase 34 n=1 Tax=Xenoophorus captivus TaxID=1517983 RepID=A0ABV0RYF3_9TELE